MRIYMHWDMEGASGLFTREHAWYWEEGVPAHVAEEGKRLLTADARSAALAALEAGADELVVCDTHHGGGNMDPAQMTFDPRMTFLPRSVGYQGAARRWMPGLDRVDFLMLPGRHAKAGTPGAFLPHTWTLEWDDFQINGVSVGEMGIEACYAGHWDVPTILVQGDGPACREAEALFPEVLTAEVKRAVSHDLCAGLEAEAARRLTAEKVAEAIAVARSGGSQPYKPALPMTVTIRMKSIAAAQAAALKPGVERLDEHAVRGRVERQCDVV
ncbi:MAG: M55 family metallopeptidase, partial [Anaerolineae bacterium]|nr:M55 family metallopeptidase [Anaerolineae bacterium]